MGDCLLTADISLTCLDDGLGAISDLQLVEDIGDVVADGLAADVQLGGDLAVVCALGDEGQDFALAVGEFGEGGNSWLRPRTVLEEGCQPTAIAGPKSAWPSATAVTVCSTSALSAPFKI